MTIEKEFELEHLVSKRAAARQVSHFSTVDYSKAPKNFKPHEKPLFLSYGTPNDGFFPVNSIKVEVADAPFQHDLTYYGDNTKIKNLDENVNIVKRTEDSSLIDIREGFQYSQFNGISKLTQFTKDFIKRVHNPGYSEWSTILSTGAGDGILKTTESILNPSDVILLEEFTFLPILTLIKEAGAIAVPIKLNVNSKSEGLDIDYLTNLLENWETLKPDLKRPKALYTIPTGQNPTGLTQSLEFRKKIYSLAEKYDFIIIEDDPYGYLTLTPFEKPDPEGKVKLDTSTTIDDYLTNHITPSYLTIDTKGRVLRIETFSKLFAPGLRIGFIVGHKRLIDVIGRYGTIVTKFPSGVSQTVLQNILYQKFKGVDGWINWILKMRAVYIHRKNLLINELTNSSIHEKGLIDIVDPRAGMFISVVLKFPENTDVEKKIELLTFKFAQFGVGVVPGLNMAVDKKFSAERGSFFRLTFAPLDNDQQVIEGSKRFVDAVEDFFAKGLNY